MAIGPGKYDGACSQVRFTTDADAVVLIVIGGKHGSGFSVQCRSDMALDLAVLLRKLADDIDADKR